MYPRKLAPVVEALLAEFRIVYLTGPRQAGKTTLARTIAERMDMGYISLDNPAALVSARNDPRGLCNLWVSGAWCWMSFNMRPA